MLDQIWFHSKFSWNIEHKIRIGIVCMVFKIVLQVRIWHMATHVNFQCQWLIITRQINVLLWTCIKPTPREPILCMIKSLMKTGLHYQSFCDHSREFYIRVKFYTFWRICKKFLRDWLNVKHRVSKHFLQILQNVELSMQNSYHAFNNSWH